MPMVKEKAVTAFYLLIVVALAVGIAFIIVGASALGHDRRYSVILSTTLLNVTSILLLISGFIIVILGIFGLIAAAKSPKRILVVMVLLTAAVILALFAGALAYCWRSKSFDELAERHLCDVRMKYGRDDNVTDYIDRSQVELKCCGSVSYYDFVGSYWWWKRNNRTKAVPVSCCVNGTDHRNCNIGVANAADIMISNSIHTTGCAILAKKWVNGLANLLWGISLALGLVLLLVLLLAALLYELGKKRYPPKKSKSSESAVANTSDTALAQDENVPPIAQDENVPHITQEENVPTERRLDTVPVGHPPMARSTHVLSKDPAKSSDKKTVPGITKGNPRYLAVKSGHIL